MPHRIVRIAAGACFLLVFIAAGVLPVSAAAEPGSPEAALTAFLKEHYPWSEVEVSDLHASAMLPNKTPADIIVERTPPGRSSFRFEFAGHKSITVTALVKAYDPVLRSRSSFRKGYILKPGDVYQTLMEADRIPKGAVRDEDRVIGKQLLRSVVPNMPITDVHVSEKPFVVRGSKVTLSADTPGFAIRTAGEMKQDASVGDRVKVINLLSKKIVTGLLLDERTVRVEF